MRKTESDRRVRLQQDIAFAERMLIDEGQIVPMFIVHTTEGDHVIATPFTSDRDKVMSRAFVSLHCIAENANALTFISEAWLRRVAKRANETSQEFNARSVEIRPSEAEDRVEVVIVLNLRRSEDGERQIISEFREIERGSDGKPTGLIKITDFDGHENMGGEMVDVFPDHAPTMAEQIAAKTLLEKLQPPEMN